MFEGILRYPTLQVNNLIYQMRLPLRSPVVLIEVREPRVLSDEL